MAVTKRQNKAKKAENKNASEGLAKLGGKDYERELAKLHAELVKLQLWVVDKGLKVAVVFEGRDGAGKGGVIKAITERVSPRVFRVVALPAPTERENICDARTGAFAGLSTSRPERYCGSGSADQTDGANSCTRVGDAPAGRADRG